MKAISNFKYFYYFYSRMTFFYLSHTIDIFKHFRFTTFKIGNFFLPFESNANFIYLSIFNWSMASPNFLKLNPLKDSFQVFRFYKMKFFMSFFFHYMKRITLEENNLWLNVQYLKIIDLIPEILFFCFS